MKLDKKDREILELLQQDARIAAAQIAERTNTSASTSWRKARALEESGIIKRYAAVVEPKKMGLDFEAVVQINLDRHDTAGVKALENTLLNCDEVIQCLSTTGDFDILIHVVCTDIDAYYAFMEQNLFPNTGVRSMRTNVVLKKIKSDAPVRLPR